jgi:2-(1,2-epoxy-1,2-dihydrophenyl)acetyl-CoA isomerase
MDYRNLDFTVDRQVAWITIDRPAAFNALDLDTMTELLDATERCATDRSVRAVVLTGSGEKAFCAGGDVAGFANNADTVERLLMAMTMLYAFAVAFLNVVVDVLYAYIDPRIRYS